MKIVSIILVMLFCTACTNKQENNKVAIYSEAYLLSVSSLDFDNIQQ